MIVVASQARSLAVKIGAITSAMAVVFTLIIASAPPARAAESTPGLLQDSVQCTTAPHSIKVTNVLGAGVAPAPWFHLCKGTNGTLYLRNLTRVVWDTNITLNQSAAGHLASNDSKAKYELFHLVLANRFANAGLVQTSAIVAPGETIFVSDDLLLNNITVTYNEEETYTWGAGRQLAASAKKAGTAFYHSVMKSTTPLGNASFVCLSLAFDRYKQYVEMKDSADPDQLTLILNTAMNAQTCLDTWDEAVEKISAPEYRLPTAKVVVFDATKAASKNGGAMDLILDGLRLVSHAR